MSDKPQAVPTGLDETDELMLSEVARGRAGLLITLDPETLALHMIPFGGVYMQDVAVIHEMLKQCLTGLHQWYAETGGSDE